MKNLDKGEFIKKLADTTGYTIGDTRHFVNSLIEVFSDCVLNDIQLDIRGFGRLYIQTLKEHVGSKPTRGVKGVTEKVLYPESKRVIFKLAKNIRDCTKYEYADDDGAEEAEIE